MSTNFKNFIPRPGLVNKQGSLPDPSELVCIEVPKVFDQCLIKRCLVYADGPDTVTTDMDLRSEPLNDPNRYLGSRDFKITLLHVDKIQSKSDPNFKKIIINYVISFCADYLDDNGVTRSELFEVDRTDVIGKFYCPDSISQISSISDGDCNCDETNTIKLEMVAEVLAGEIVRDENGDSVLDITLGYFIVVKCQLLVQLLVPVYDYCPVPNEPCDEDPEEDPCEIFEKAPVPKFYPDQNLEPLFQEQECEREDS